MRQPPSPVRFNTVPSCDCESNPIACLEQMFVQMVQLRRIQRGQCPARRPVFLRLHGVVHGRLEVVSNLSKNLRVGLFSETKSYPVWVRYSSDLPDGDPDLESTVGIGIKVFDVPGEKILPPDEYAPTIDLLLQNIDIFFVDNAYEMCAFTKATLTSPEVRKEWLEAHPRTQEILDEMKKVVPSVLETDLWSAMPFHFGENHFCKYKLEPEIVPPGSDPDYDDPNYLHADLRQRLQQGEARLKFLIQLQSDPETMPLDRATVRWSETASPPIHAATLILPAQDISARGQPAYGETLSFNPWRTLITHQPIGSIAEARKVVYQASATLRRNVNGEPIGEPQEIRPSTIWPAAKDSYIVRAAIHPGIGVARVGNSKAEDGFFIGPEVIQATHGNTRDAEGAIKRQAARFRIYGYNAAGEVVGELTSNNADVEWTVHLANRKAQWYQFQVPFDIPEAQDLSVPRRNPTVADREILAIDPGPRTIKGKGTSGAAYQFDVGEFMGVTVPLGELRTDSVGHLLVLGGFGDSGSPQETPIYNPDNPDSFNNADGWFDDISDGPVAAKVTIAGRDIPVEASWVFVGPPNYAPDVIGWRTLYDLLVDTYVECGWMPLPTKASFTQDILPILSRLSNLQWVNKGFATLFGRGRPMDFTDPHLIAKLAHQPKAQDDPYHELRRVIFNIFRPANTECSDRSPWPWIYGDAFGSAPPDSPRNNLALSRVRMQLMEFWVNGNFVNDWTPDLESPSDLNQVSLAEQPAMLDQAALHFCLADAFHPGCEVTWPMRHSTLYTAPFRIRRRPDNEPESDYGRTLTQEIALQPGGPLSSQGPGDVTRWMALPWQGDTAFCRSGYDPQYDPYIPTFWPARVPNQVLTEENYQIVINQDLPREQRLAAYYTRANWLRSLKGTAPDQMLQMVAEFGKMGIIEPRPGIENDPDFPPVIFVESLTAERVEALRVQFDALRLEEPSALPANLQQAGWESIEQLEEFQQIIFS
ncbi:MAG: LodA/GoxA family CTQ-dependent oxidase [Pseudanabaenales cyanobacterium]|nr:LodA/GoxA family CTQ-dependent oxidase [Pseudanabaenales cyanobacterium]